MEVGNVTLLVVTTAERIFEKAKELSPPLQREALDFIDFLAERQQAPDPDSPEFTSELLAAFTEAKAGALKNSGIAR
jgi:hypothetical protein